jgi:hypothetical protein
MDRGDHIFLCSSSEVPGYSDAEYEEHKSQWQHILETFLLPSYLNDWYDIYCAIMSFEVYTLFWTLETISLLSCYQSLEPKMYVHWGILVCSLSMAADRHRSVQIYSFNCDDSMLSGVLINSWPIESVLGRTS